MTDEEFLAAFEGCALEDFRHRDHVKVAYLYLLRYPLAEAMVKVRTGLQALAVAWNAPVDDLEKGYHETMTQAWVRLVEVRLRDGGSAENAEAFCERESQLMQKNCLETFYSRERLFTWTAKREYVEPDLVRFECSRENDLALREGAVITNV